MRPRGQWANRRAAATIAAPAASATSATHCDGTVVGVDGVLVGPVDGVIGVVSVVGVVGVVVGVVVAVRAVLAPAARVARCSSWSAWSVRLGCTPVATFRSQRIVTSMDRLAGVRSMHETMSEIEPQADEIRVLFVCTANVCRSPMAAALLRARLTGRGPTVAAASAGTHAFPMAGDKRAQRVMSELGVAMAHETARSITPELLAHDGRDLVITMSHEHLRAVVLIDGSAWHRTFQFRDLMIRAAIAGPRAAYEDVCDWVRRLAQERTASELFRESPAEDVADPFRRSMARYRETAAELDELVSRLVELARW